RKLGSGESWITGQEVISRGRPRHAQAVGTGTDAAPHGDPEALFRSTLGACDLTPADVKTVEGIGGERTVRFKVRGGGFLKKAVEVRMCHGGSFRAVHETAVSLQQQ
ncbi:MAG TPA: hypothetical protein VHH13_06145, partial [Arthrobacter sp.]|nr:hypothetical protein [Arthrobacter sp.]